ncbi:hypothetical protein SDRG_10557 [Saprolegnia diclina VS20]|uniref:Uncharacterized protein n=1 Tax=Saprolegnia diclina (strain VS20) TaxID=1156394 RepID=T0RHH4_SAPDV|nr:hypothetical protein SDRG_10557 [Saprolegnia diclina VS20]EQC31768.1 hypothetical protein SDRG_10557 [Saprolegnia diclina VS20]|eukprot:XP_008614775.1 hypothetical protein SDRG_10557 [Saprolegnia diclina VS20]
MAKTLCMFKDCRQEALYGCSKCAFHKRRKKCSFPECHNQVYARGLCVRHGGKKPCAIEHCTNAVNGGDYCVDHGGLATKRFCVVDGCKKQAHARKRCVRHGGGRICAAQGCGHHARLGGFCLAHTTPDAAPPATLELEQVAEFLHTIDEPLLEYLHEISVNRPWTATTDNTKRG